MYIIKQILAIVFAFLMSVGYYTPESLEIANVPEKADDAVRIVSFNVRCADDLYGSVKVRSQLICAALEQYKADSFGVQEATQQWLDILEENLGEQYGIVAQMRDDSIGAEASAVYYLKEKYDLVDSGTFWLSDTPDEFGSKFFASSLPRIATWAKLQNKTSGEIYVHINTHLDHVLESARVQQIGVLISKVEEFKAQGYPVVCTGDFNTEEGADAYMEMDGHLLDTKYIAKVSDEGATYHNYGQNIFDKKPIDFIFVSEGVEVDTYKIIDEKIDKIYLSDHAGLCADIRF